MNAPILRLAVGSLEKLGFTTARKGAMQMIEEDRRIPVLDIGAVKYIRSGAIKVRARNPLPSRPTGVAFARRRRGGVRRRGAGDRLQAGPARACCPTRAAFSTTRADHWSATASRRSPVSILSGRWPRRRGSCAKSGSARRGWRIWRSGFSTTSAALRRAFRPNASARAFHRGSRRSRAASCGRASRPRHI